MISRWRFIINVFETVMSLCFDETRWRLFQEHIQCALVGWRVFITLCRVYCEVNVFNIHLWSQQSYIDVESQTYEMREFLLIHEFEIKLLNQKMRKIVHCNSRLIKIWLVSLKKSDEISVRVMSEEEKKKSYMKAYGRRKNRWQRANAVMIFSLQSSHVYDLLQIAIEKFLKFSIFHRVHCLRVRIMDWWNVINKKLI